MPRLWTDVEAVYDRSSRRFSFLRPQRAHHLGLSRHDPDAVPGVALLPSALRAAGVIAALGATDAVTGSLVCAPRGGRDS